MGLRFVKLMKCKLLFLFHIEYRYCSTNSEQYGKPALQGFPNSVTPDYVPFQVWDLLQGLSTYVRMMLSTQALLSAIGVGEKSATVIGATFQWFLRDLSGMIGGILFTCYQGSNLDSNAKMWRLIADFMNDLGMLMDLLSPLLPSAFLFILCLGSLSRSFTGVASGATRAALTQHFALQDNAADISAKEGSQETVATMIGMAFGMLLARITNGHAIAIWISFLSLTIFHMYVLSPKQVSTMEHILPLWMTSWSPKSTLHKNVSLGVRITSLKFHEMEELLKSAGSHYRKAKYLLLEKNGIVSVVVHKDSTAADILQSFIHALVMSKLAGEKRDVHMESELWIEKHYKIFISKSSGWKTERLLSPSIGWRANWLLEPSDDKAD
nr:protein root UVB sensitive 3 [Ipomoea batatas]